jgi:hypothetical protein
MPGTERERGEEQHQRPSPGTACSLNSALHLRDFPVHPADA